MSEGGKREREGEEEKQYTIEEVVDHRKKRKKQKVILNQYEYKVKWEGSEEETWESGGQFCSGGFVLCEYWKMLADRNGKVKEGGKEKVCVGERMEEQGDGEGESHEIKSILDHVRVDGSIFYKVVWISGGTGDGKVCDWIVEESFDSSSEILLGEYWRKVTQKK